MYLTEYISNILISISLNKQGIDANVTNLWKNAILLQIYSVSDLIPSAFQIYHSISNWFLIWLINTKFPKKEKFKI